MQKKMQNSLLAVNIGVLACFMGGVAVILYNEDMPVMPAASDEPATSVAEAYGFTLRQEADAQVDTEMTMRETSAAKPEKCDKSSKECGERSLLVPIIFAFLAGGLINLPEVSSLPCI